MGAFFCFLAPMLARIIKLEYIYTMKEYVVNNEEELNSLIERLLTKDRGAYIGYDVDQVIDNNYPIKVKSSAKIKV